MGFGNEGEGRELIWKSEYEDGCEMDGDGETLKERHN